MASTLIITRHYMDENNGGSNASKGFIWSLASINEDLTLIYPEHDDFDSRDFIPISVKRFPVYDNRAKVRKGLDVYRGRLHRFVDFTKKHLAKKKYDLIILDHSISAAGIIWDAKRSGSKIVTIHHNVEANYIKDNQPSWLYRIPFNYFSKKAERDALCLSDVNLTLTVDDAKVFESWYPSRNLHLHSVGICEYRKEIERHFEQFEFNKTFVISGSLNFHQSAAPIIEFIKKFYPIMKRDCPDCKLIITGRNPNDDVVQACANQDGIELIPNPENMDEVIKQASVYICPINAGSGIKLRVMDGLRRGLPVICHKVSAVGYESIEKMGGLYSYDDKKSFENVFENVMKKKFDPDAIYAQYNSVFSFSAGVERVKKILSDENLYMQQNTL